MSITFTIDYQTPFKKEEIGNSGPCFRMCEIRIKYPVNCASGFSHGMAATVEQAIASINKERPDSVLMWNGPTITFTG